ncbi:MAG: hypothetical protein Q9162_004410 [Coniocarpon cinnabarinum]
MREFGIDQLRLEPLQPDALRKLARILEARKDLAIRVHSVQVKCIHNFSAGAEALSRVLLVTPHVTRLGSNSLKPLQDILPRSVDPVRRKEAPLAYLTEIALNPSQLGRRDGLNSISFEEHDSVPLDDFVTLTNLPSIDKVAIRDLNLSPIHAVYPNYLDPSPMFPPPINQISHLTLFFTKDIATHEDCSSLLARITGLLRCFSILRVLHISCEWFGMSSWNPELGSVIQRFSHTLEKLTLLLPNQQSLPEDESRAEVIIGIEANMVGSLANFEKLSYLRIAIQEVSHTDGPEYVALSLPTNLEELHFHHVESYSEYFNHNVVIAVALVAHCGRFPKLRNITCHIHENQVANREDLAWDEEWFAVAYVCAKHNVNFTLYSRAKLPSTTPLYQLVEVDENPNRQWVSQYSGSGVDLGPPYADFTMD